MIDKRGITGESQSQTKSGKFLEPMDGWPRLYRSTEIHQDAYIIPEEKLLTPPSLNDGLAMKTEKELRFLGCELIQAGALLLKLPQTAAATGQVLFQRFYYCKSFVRYQFEHTAMASLYLASKVEESPRRIRDVINVFHHLRLLRQKKKPTPKILDEAYTLTKNEVIKAERRVLKELGFCVHVKHPHKLINCYLQILGYVPDKDSSDSELSNLIQYAWNCMNDGLRSDIFMRYTPESIACGCIYLAGRKSGIPLPQQWWNLFDCKESDLIDIATNIYRQYFIKKPSWLGLEAHVRELRMRLKERDEAKKESRGLASASCTPGGGATPAQTEKSKFSPKDQRRGRRGMHRDRRQSESGDEGRGGPKRPRNKHYRGASSGSYSSRSRSPIPRKGNSKRLPIYGKEDKLGRYKKFHSKDRHGTSPRKRKRGRSRSISLSPEDRRKEIQKAFAEKKSKRRK